MTDPTDLFKHRLALSLGILDVEDIDDLTDGKFNGWVRYANTEPFGFPRDEVRFAQIPVAIMAASPGKVSRKMLDMSFWSFRPTIRQTVQQMSDAIKSGFNKSGKRRKRKPNPEA